MKVLIALKHRFGLWQWPDWATQRLRADFPSIDFRVISNLERLRDELTDSDVLVGWQLRGDQFEGAKRLRWIHSPAAAVHQLMFPELMRSDVILTNGSSIHAAPVAEHTLALMLAIARAIPGSVRAQVKHQWAQQQLWESATGLTELRGNTVLIVGLGHIGREVAARLKAFGATVIGIREHPERGRGAADEIYGPSALDSLLGRAGYIVLAAPVTPKTEHLLGKAQFERMRRDAILVNVGRGALIDEQALIDALRDHRIGAAALDVFAEEPLPPGSPLWELEDVLITPHLGSACGPMWQRQIEFIENNLRHLLAGEPLDGVVEKQRGY